jgi:uncharacterized radical SAM superfamily protein
LGCMRPKGKLRIETDVLALQAGAEGWLFQATGSQICPTRGHQCVFSTFCCAQIHQDKG